MEGPKADPKRKVILTRQRRLEVVDYETSQVTLTVPMGDGKSQIFSGLSPCKKLFWAHNDKQLVILNFKEVVVLQKEFEQTIDSFYFIDKAHIAVTLRLSANASEVHVIHGPSKEVKLVVPIDFGQRRCQFLRADLEQSLVWVQKTMTTVELGRLDAQNRALAESKVIVEEAQISDLIMAGDFVFVVSNSIRNEQNKSISRVQVFDKTTGELKTKRDFKGVHEAKIQAAPDGLFALILVSKFIDKTNEFYYGKDAMYSFCAKAKKNESDEVYYDCSIKKMETYQGNVHDWKLIPKSGQAIIISGKMPARSVLYNFKGNPTYLLEHNFRSLVAPSPNHTVVALCGFGQLSGEIMLFSLKKNNAIGRAQSSYASWLKWSSDGAKFLTATVLSKLNENHQYSVFDYRGNLLKKVKVPENDLVSVDFYFSKKLVKKLNLATYKIESRSGGITLGGARENSRKISTADIINYNKQQTGGQTLGGVKVFSSAQSPSLSFGMPKLTRKK